MRVTRKIERALAFHVTRTSPEPFLAPALRGGPPPAPCTPIFADRQSTPHSNFGYFPDPCDAPCILCYCLPYFAVINNMLLIIYY